MTQQFKTEKKQRHARFANALQRAESHARRQFRHKDALQLVRRLLEAAKEAHIVAGERRRTHVERERNAAVGAAAELDDLGQRRVQRGRVLKKAGGRLEKKAKPSEKKDRNFRVKKSWVKKSMHFNLKKTAVENEKKKEPARIYHTLVHV